MTFNTFNEGNKIDSSIPGLNGNQSLFIPHVTLILMSQTNQLCYLMPSLLCIYNLYIFNIIISYQSSFVSATMLLHIVFNFHMRYDLSKDFYYF